MMRLTKYIITLFLCLFCSTAIFSQNVKSGSKNIKKELQATVLDQKGKPMQGVSIIANEGADRTETDGEGRFTIQAKINSSILFQKEGYREISISGRKIEENEKIVVLLPNLLVNVQTLVDMPYQTRQQSKISGAVNTINIDEELTRDLRFDINSALRWKVAGLRDVNDIHGLGTAVYVIDGFVRSPEYLNLQEVEQITLLKDPVSRMLYGAQGDAGVIMIKTRNGQANNKQIKFDFEYGIQKAIAYPNYLDAASYMETYNRAYLNDGGNSSALPFSSDVIGKTRSKSDPVLYPDVNYYDSNLVKDITSFSNLYGETSGGNDKVRYIMNLGWKHNNDWIKSNDKNQQDKMHIRGKVEFEVNPWLKMHADASAVFDITNMPNVETVNGTTTENFWTKSSSFLPNSYPLLIPKDRVSNLADLPGIKLIDNQYLLGGTTVYQTNLLGDLTQKGNVSKMNRFLQFKTGLDLNLEKITKGLTAKAAFNAEFINQYHQSVENSYAVYEINKVNDDGKFELIKIGNDKTTTSQTISHDFMNFNRKLEAYASINYQRVFDKHDISAVLVGYGKHFIQKDIFQDEKRLNFGLQASYTYDDKYIAEAGFLSQGSGKMSPENRWATSPSLGVAWVITNENFGKSLPKVDYLKLRASMGTILNDNWLVGNYSGYFLYEPSYLSSYVFNYNNGNNKNNSILINSFGNKYNWQKRDEFVVGFDSYLFDRQTWVEASYFNSTTKDIIVELSNTSPATMGAVKSFGNYNSTRYNGFETGIKQKINLGNVKLNLGLTYMFTNSTILKYEEPVYNTPENQHLSRIGKSQNSMWGLKAERLYSDADFDTNGNLLSTLPAVQYGNVKPGDIKYFDYNQDGMINDNDQHVIGRSSNNHFVGFSFEVNYRKLQFFVLTGLQAGGRGYTNSDYYWFKGNSAKYSEIALDAYNPDAPNSDAKYPRLSLTAGNNNYRNSTFWQYDRTNFSLAALQLSYKFDSKASLPIRNCTVYARGSNLLTIAKDKQILEMNVGMAPQNRVFALGFISSF